MVDEYDVEAILAQKAAGVARMRARQERVHNRMADYVEAHPEVIVQGLSKVREQLAKSHCTAREIYREWERVLELGSASYVAAILRDTSETTEQLRACAPFKIAGLEC